MEINILKSVAEISIKQEQEFKEYSICERFDAKGLILNVRYEDGTQGEVIYSDINKVLFMFTPNSLIPGTTEVTVLYGGKYTTTPITMVDKAYILYYYNSTIKKVHSLYTYEGDESNVISALDNIISAGAVGFYRVSA